MSILKISILENFNFRFFSFIFEKTRKPRPPIVNMIVNINSAHRTTSQLGFENPSFATNFEWYVPSTVLTE